MCILNSPKTALERGFRKRVNNLWIVNSIKERGCIKALSRSDWVDTRDLERVMVLLQPTNELVCRLCLETGLRISDALSLTVEQVRKKKFSILEQKTGKRKCINFLRGCAMSCLCKRDACIYFLIEVTGRERVPVTQYGKI